MEDTPKYYYLYPIYFDAEKSCSEARRLPVHLCRKNPQARELFQAAQSLSMNAELEINKSHPRSINGSGRVKIKCFNEFKKNQILFMIAEKLMKMPKNIVNPVESSKSAPPRSAVEIAPNVVYQMRPKKNKKNK